ncbi:cation:dicarboxylase symporter family transporter [Paenibacillus kribbensis]|uniref:Glutamate:protein symporter n=1 Tax=Paenibacillus kribbensis TaxID=172713 RepID=A0A222WLY8_9BACL|nr:MULTISPECIES: cation:dicarboxylase symporter family transporter [Paenibacillus]ASR47510.1 glutamate:protein symporter [Paenibacillus kribbensis]EHS57589.1 sodium:dicarboxylate symporter [Paenibacillus sp. Aloe-11]MEC0236259.1 cation:dicarboxylase symporter family transporter [Paenibacillus kribbensis]
MKKLGLAWQILIGLALGIAVGAIFYGNPLVTDILTPIGDVFIRLIKMIVLPIVISSLVVGIAGSGDMKKLGKIGFKTILYFEIITTVAIVIGLFAGNFFKPGLGIDMSHLAKTDIHQYVNTAENASHHSLADTFVNIVPTNIVQAMGNGDLLAIIFFSVLFGVGISVIGEKGKPVIHFLEAVSEAMFWMTNQIMKLAPLGVFALIGVTVAKFGISSLIPLGKLVIILYLSMFVFVLVVLGIVAKMCGTSIVKILKLLKDEIILAFSTASSEAVLPKLMLKMEQFGCPKSIVSFVVPTGYTFNLAGSALYQSLATLFIVQMYGINLPIWSQISIVVVLMLTSKGMAGVSGASLVVLLATVNSVGLPVEGVALIAGIDRILDMARTVVNVVGNGIASVVIAKWEGQFDHGKADTQK